MNPLADYQRRFAAIRTAVAAQIVELFHGLGNWQYPDEFQAAAAPIITGAQLAVAQLVDATAATVAGTTPVGLTLDAVTDLRAGVTAPEVLRRPFVTVWTGLSKDYPIERAVSAGAARAKAIATTDVLLAQREAMAIVADETPRIVGYRRTLTGKSCALCAAASTQRYRGKNAKLLMPIHDHCDCGVAPILAGSDPGHVINRKVLDRLRARGPEYWKSNGFVDPDGNPMDPATVPTDFARVEQHDELGPYLTPA